MIKMRKISILSLCLLFLLVGCSKKEEPTKETGVGNEQTEAADLAGYERAIEKGKQAIKDGQYDKAVASFELAIEYGTKDDLAKELLKQVTDYQEIVRLMEQNDQEKCLEAITALLESENLEVDLKQQVEELKKEIENNSTNETSLWNEDKAIKLKQFMTSWGNEMGQQYQEYNPDINVDLYDLFLPKGVLEGVMQMAVNRAPVSIEWSTDGTGQAEYQLVAVHSDADKADYLDAHVYFFVIHNGEPKVLLTMQNQGNEYN